MAPQAGGDRDAPVLAQVEGGARVIELVQPLHQVVQVPGRRKLCDRRRVAVRLSWAWLLKRVFALDLAHCLICVRKLTLITAILEQPVIEHGTAIGSRSSIDAPALFGQRMSPPQVRGSTALRL